MSLYAAPAFLALIAKLAILYLARRSDIRNAQTRLFAAAAFCSIVLSAAEISGLQRLFASSPRYEATIYFVASVSMMAIFAHLAIAIGGDDTRYRRRALFTVPLYGYAIALMLMLLSTPLIVVGVEPFRGYTVTRVPGRLYGLYELFLVATSTIMVFFPGRGVLTLKGLARSRCVWWLVGAIPLVALIVVVVTLLHFEVRWFNSTVTAPLLVTALLGSVGYSVHNRRIVEVDHFLPWSKTKKIKGALYSGLIELANYPHSVTTLDDLVNRISVILRCSVALLGNGGTVLANAGFEQLDLSDNDLRGIHQTLVVDEMSLSARALHQQLNSNGIGLVAPFFVGSRTSACWLILGRSCRDAVHAPRDFRVLEELFRRSAGAILDQLLISREHGSAVSGAAANATDPSGDRNISGEKTTPTDPNGGRADIQLPQLMAQLEADIIRQTLARCGGNQAEAARLLGIRPNTLYYKIGRYGLNKKPSI